MSVPISMSAVLYDGHPFPAMLDSLASCGAAFVEPAYIAGYTDPFDESEFTTAHAREHQRWLEASGIGCHAFSSHYDLGRPDAVDLFTRRMAFGAAMGARVVNTNAAKRADADAFFRNIEALSRAAEALDLTIALENPGDGSDNLFNTVDDGLSLVAELGLPAVRLNYDVGNAVTHRRQVNPVASALAVLPGCAYVHVKDLVKEPAGWRFVPPGEGQIGYDRIMPALVASGTPFSVQLPLRVRRSAQAEVMRGGDALPLQEIEAAVKTCLAYVGRFTE